MNGIILLNKEKNKTSRDMVNKLNHIFGVKKIGHTGTLDPIATGILVMCVGKYTKLVDMLSSIRKEYIATIKVGMKTDTLDITGNVLEQRKCQLDESKTKEVINNLAGKHIQTIPIYSAKKINGKKLYEYARENKKVDLPTNEIEIYESSLISINSDEITFKVLVSKGTYIRSLIENICNNLNIIGTMSNLVRTKQGNFDIKDSSTINDIEKGKYKLLKVSDVLDIKTYNLNEEEYKKVKNGNKMNFNFDSEEMLLIYENNEIAIYEKNEDIYKVKIMLI